MVEGTIKPLVDGDHAHEESTGQFLVEHDLLPSVMAGIATMCCRGSCRCRTSWVRGPAIQSGASNRFVAMSFWDDGLEGLRRYHGDPSRGPARRRDQPRPKVV